MVLSSGGCSPQATLDFGGQLIIAFYSQPGVEPGSVIVNVTCIPVRAGNPTLLWWAGAVVHRVCATGI
jgi:hypothetical protein